MSFTATNMFGRPIWGSEQKVSAAARRAGWTGADIRWECLQELGNRELAKGDLRAAASAFRRAHWIAVLRFPRRDLRRATSLANLGVVDLARSRDRRGKARLRSALSHWDRYSAAAIDAMQIAPRARSSLFHLRMEALHREAYYGNLKLRIGRIAEETRETLEAIVDDRSSPHRHFDRWQGERPSVYDDTRKVLSACLVLAKPATP